LTQEQFAGLLGQYASLKATEEASFRSAMKRELDALGVNATMRVTALETWLKGMVPGDVAKSMVSGLFSEKQVRGLELIATRMASQGAATFSQAHREPNTGDRGPLSSMSDAEYNALSAGEKYAIAKAG
jgi:hypothetical protein